MKTRLTSLLVVICCTFALRAHAQSNEVIVDSLITNEASGTISNAMISLGDGYLWARGDFGERPGSDESFFTAGGFGGVYLFGPNEFTFMDGRVWVTDNTRVGGEMGIGQRFVFDRVAFGVNSFLTYDTGQMAENTNHTRISVGGEVLMDHFSFTANGYLPLNDDPRRFGEVMFADKLMLMGNQAVFQNMQMAEQQMQGVDYELAVQIPRMEWLSVSGGGYYFEANDGGENVNGVLGRIGIDLTSVLFDVSVQDDDRFGTTVNAGAEFRLGSGPAALVPRYRNLQTKIVDRVRHRERVALNQFLVTDNEVAINPATGLPFTFINVDITAAPGGDGSFENRFNDLGLANGPDGDIILVWRGDSSALNPTPNTGGLQLDDNQQIYGQGTNLFLQTVNRIDPVALCDFTDIGTNPFVDAPINLANNNIVQGLNILTGPGMNAIGGTNVSNFQILDINQDIGAGFTGPGGGIVLNNATGDGLISNFQYRTANAAAPGGIVINNVNAADLDLTILDAPVIEGGAAGIALLADNSSIEADISNVQATGNGDGLVLNGTNGGDVTANVVNSGFNNATMHGAELDATAGGEVVLNASNTNFENAGIDAINAQLDGGTGSANLNGSSLIGAVDDAFDLSLTNSSDFNLILTNVIGDGVGGDGVVVNATAGSTMMGNITNSSFDGVGEDAFELNFDNSTGTLALTNTSGAMAGQDAINIDASNGAGVGLMLQDSTEFSGAAQDGLEITNTGSAVTVLANSSSDTPVDFSNFGTGNGLTSTSTGAGATTDITFIDGANFDNVLGNGAQDAIRIISNNGAATTFSGTAVSGQNAGDDGINLMSNGGSINATISAAGSFANAGQNSPTGDGIEVVNSNGGLITLNLDGAGDSVVDFSGAANNGLNSFSQDATTQTTLNFNDGANFNNAGNDAIGVVSNGGAVTDINGRNMTGTNAGGDAFDLDATGPGSVIDIDLTGTNTFTDAMNNGINSVNTGGAFIDVNIANADFSSTMAGTLLQDGLFSFTEGAGTSNFTFNTGAAFDGASDDAIDLVSNLGATTNLTGVGISGSMAGDDGIALNSLGGTINVNMTQTGSFAGAGDDGIDFIGTNATLNINVAGTPGTPADFSGAGNNGVIGFLDNSTGTLNLANTNFDNAATGNGMLVSAVNGSTFTGTATNSTFNNAALNGIETNIDGSVGQLNLSNVNANMAGGTGLFLTTQDSLALGTSTLDVNLGNANFNDAQTGDAIRASAIDGSYIDIDGFNVNGMNAAQDGIDLDADASQIDLTLFAADPLVPNNFTMAGGSGLDFVGTNGSTINVGVSDTNFDGATAFGINGALVDSTGTMNLTRVTANNAGNSGLNLLANNSTLSGNLNTVDFNDAGADAITVNAIMGSTVNLTGVDVNGMNATAQGINLDANASVLNFTLNASNPLAPNNFTNSGGNGLDYNGINGSTVNVAVSNTNFDDTVASGIGVSGSLTDSTGTLNLVNVTANNAGMQGMQLLNSNSTLSGGLTNVSLNDAGQDAIFISGVAASDVDLAMNNVMGLRAGDDGFDIVANGIGTDINIQISNSNFSDAFNNGLEFDFQNQANIVFNSDNALIVDNAGQSAAIAGMGDAINLFGDTLATADIDITSGSLLNAFDDMTDATMIMGGAFGSVLIDPTPATGAGDNGVEFEVMTGGRFDFTLIDSDLSTAGDPVGNNGVLGTVDNGIVNLNFINSDINNSGLGGATGDGINVTATNASDLSLNLTNSDLMNWANGNGVILDITDSDAIVNLGGANISGAGADAVSISGSTGGSGLQSGSNVMVDLGTGTNLDGAGDNALEVNSIGVGTTVNVIGTGTSGANAMGDAIQTNSDLGSILNLQLTNAGSFANAGGSGINATADNSSIQTVTINNAGGTAANFDGAGMFAINGDSLGGSSLTMNLLNVSGDGATLGGLNLSAEGPLTTLSGVVTDASFVDTGIAGMDGSFGVQVEALNGATIGNFVNPGLVFDNIVTGNTDPTFTNLTQDHGVLVNVDGDSFANLSFNNLTAIRAEDDGFQANVNGDVSVDDTSLLLLQIANSTINDNLGDGVELNAQDGPTPVFAPQSAYGAGISANIVDSSIQFNGNSINHPGVDMQGSNSALDADNIGYGLIANADDNFITVNFDNVDLTDNEEGTALGNATNNGIVIFNFAGGVFTDPVLICADGPGSFASASYTDVTITGINGNNAAISMRATGGGTAIGEFTNVTIDDVEAQAFAFLSQGAGSTVNATFNGLNINDAAYGAGTFDTKTALPLHAVLQGIADGGVANITLNNVNIDDTETGTPTIVNALDMDAISGGTLNLNIDTFAVAQDGLTDSVTNAEPLEGEIDVYVDGTTSSVANINFANIDVDFSDGKGVNLTDGGTNGTFNLIQLENISANSATDIGFNLEGVAIDADGIITLNNSSFNNAGTTGVNIDVRVPGDTELNITNTQANNAGLNGILANLNAVFNPANLDVNVTNSQADNAMGGSGLSVLTQNIGPGTSDVTISGGSSFDNAFDDGIAITMNGNTAATGTVSITDTTATGAMGMGPGGGDGIRIVPSSQIDITNLTIDNVDVSGAADRGLEMSLVDQMNAATIDISNFTANDTGNLAIDLDLVNVTGGDSSVSLLNVTANNTDPMTLVAGGGIDINFDNVTNNMGAGSHSITLDGVSAQNAQTGPGLNIAVDLGIDFDDFIDVNIDNTISGVTNDFSGAAGDGINIDLSGLIATTGEVHVEDVIANNVGDNGVDVNVMDGITVEMGNSFNRIVALNATNDGLQITSDAGSTIATAIRGTENVFDGAGGNGILIDIAQQQTPLAIELSETTANNAGLTGVDITLSGVHGATMGNPPILINLANVDATGAMTGEGLDLNILGVFPNEFVDINITDSNGDGTGDRSDFSGAQLDGVNIEVTGGPLVTTDLSINGVTANDSVAGHGFFFRVPAGSDVNINDFANLTTNNNFRDGIDLAFDGNTVSVGAGTFMEIISTGNDENGLLLDVFNGATIDPIVFAASNDFSNNGAGAGFDGVDVRVHDTGSTADLTFNGMTVDNNGGRGLDLDAYAGGSLTFNVIGGSISNNGLQGIDINVGQIDEFPTTTPALPGTFNGLISGVNASNNGVSPVFTADNINAVYTNGSTGTLEFNAVTANNADGDGIDVLINQGSNVDVLVNNGTTANNNTNSVLFNAVGFRFTADGGATTADLFMDDMQAINMFNMNETQGALITLTNAVTMPNLEVFAEGDMNGDNGIEINATDGTGVSINNLNVAGAQADNNMGSGLVVDLNQVGGITDFTLSNASFQDNLGDQVYLGFRNMLLTDLTIGGAGGTVTVDGEAASGDGLEINLNNTQISNLLAIDGLIATNNGQNGLNITALDSMIGDGTYPVVDNTTGGYIINSLFSGNAAQYDRTILNDGNDDFAGALIRLTDSVANFDIYDNDAATGNGFVNNLGIGLNVQVEDDSQFTMAGMSFLNNGSRSFYNNNIQNNAGFGVLFEITEPSDTDPLDPSDGISPLYTLELGDILEDPNDMTGNGDAALALIGSNDSIGSLNIVNAIMNDTVNGDDARFNGDGLAVLLQDEAELEELIIDGTTAGLTVNNNAGSGIRTSIFDDSNLGTVTRFTVQTTTITNNGLHGIDVQRDDDALYGPDPNNNGIIIGGVTAPEGNILMGNGMNGLNVVYDNTAVSPIPFDMQVRSNQFIGNGLNGIFANAQADARFSGRFSDNMFMAQGQDGVQIRLENDTALGNPGLGSDPFLMDGNIIQGSTRHGIFFDTNFFNESGTAGGSAFVNVLIQESETRDNIMGVSIKSLISSNGGNGIQIIDNSEFLGNASTVVAQNTYDIRGTNIMSNGQNGIFLEQGERTDPTGPSMGVTRDANNGIALLIGRPFGTSEYIGKRDVEISLNLDDGIDLEYRDGDNISNLLDLDSVTISSNGSAGDNQGNTSIAGVAGPQNVGHGLEIEVGEGNQNVNDTGRLIANFNNVDVTSNFGDGFDWNVTSLRSGPVAIVNMFDVNSSMNGGRGMDVALRHDRVQTVGGNSNAYSIWNIGRGDFAFDLTQTNQFNSNTREGIVFDISARDMDSDTVNVATNFPHYNQTDINGDVFVEVNLGQGITTPLDLPSTKHGYYTGEDANGNGVLDPGEDTLVVNAMLDHRITSVLSQGTFTDPFTNGVPVNPGDETILNIDGTGVHVNTFIQLVNTEVASNGGFGGFEDGVDIAVGALTRANVIIGNASFGGNRGDDIRIYAQRSIRDNGTDINPPDSFRDTSNDGSHSFIVYDPVAYIDLAFGVVDSTGGYTVDTTAGNGNAATSATGGGGFGDQVSFTSFGSNATATRTNDGVYTNADPIKPDSRQVRLAGVVVGATPGTGAGDRVAGGSDDNNNNVFIENFVQQDINAIFNGAATWLTYAALQPDTDGDGAMDGIFFIDTDGDGVNDTFTFLPVDNHLNRVGGGTDPQGY